jgi:hypothetical protein
VSLASVVRVGERGRGVEIARSRDMSIAAIVVAATCVGGVKLAQARAFENDEYEPCISAPCAKSYKTEELGRNRLMLRPWFCAEWISVEGGERSIYVSNSEGGIY